MSSIIHGYEYDIFISYRQKDNQLDGWVTDFVNQLKGELAATFKEEISVYFDINPHDGLLETHDVDASLKDKLKCLIFIPIISRTYCDPKSFAWEHEFKAFVDLASNDQFGLKIKLPNGNVANRVLPVRIHDLDIADIKECESVLGGALRGIEFIYKEPGADKPLAPEDNEKKNLNNTKYRIQIIKVAHAIKEVIQGLTGKPGNTSSGRYQYSDLPEEAKIKDRIEEYRKGTKLNRFNLLSGTLILMFLIIGAIIVYPKIFDHDNLANLRSPDGRISIAVMPFQNITNDTIWNVWQDGIQDNLITSLAFSDGLKVRKIESINGVLKSEGLISSASMTPAFASSISQKLDASILIYGNINKAGLTLRINARLIDPKSTEALKSFQIDGAPENILNMIDSLSRMVTNFLLISKLKTEFSPTYKYYASTNSPEAYRYFMYGQKSMNSYGSNTTSRNWFLQAISIDSNLITAVLQIAQLYEWDYNYDEAQKWCLKAYEKRDKMTLQNKLLTNIMYANLFETPNEMLNYWEQLIEIEDQIPLYLYLIGRNYYDVEQYDKAIPDLEKALEILKKWDSKPEPFYYMHLLRAYHKSGKHFKEKELYNIVKQDTGLKPLFDSYQIDIALDEGDTNAAKRYYSEYLPSFKHRRFYGTDTTEDTTAAGYMLYLADFYFNAGIVDQAESYYRKLLLLYPNVPWALMRLASIHIVHDQNTEEGMVFINRAIELKPDKYLMCLIMDAKGWGLYKQGKYKEALEILQRNWDFRIKNHFDYVHSAYLHLEKVKNVTKLLAEQGKL